MSLRPINKSENVLGFLYSVCTILVYKYQLLISYVMLQVFDLGMGGVAL